MSGIKVVEDMLGILASIANDARANEGLRIEAAKLVLQFYEGREQRLLDHDLLVQDAAGES